MVEINKIIIIALLIFIIALVFAFVYIFYISPSKSSIISPDLLPPAPPGAESGEIPSLPPG